jgi:bloom syndrome protein
LGAPITSDERLDELDDAQHIVLIDFTTDAKNLRRELVAKNDLRQPIFSDIVLREMCLELPISLDEMRSIPGIKEDMVARFGKRFLPLIATARAKFNGNLPKRRYLKPVRHVRRQIPEEDDDEEDEVVDPNRVNVIDLCSDGEVLPAAEDSESNYFDSDDDDEDDDGEPHISHHFTPHVDPEVEAFNSRMTQLGPTVPKTAARAPARGGSRAPGGKKGKPFRRNGSGSFGRTNAGVKKRAPKGASSRASCGAAAPRKSAGAGRKGGDSGGGGGTLAGPWSTIMAMPT